jgi:hypothetical protein
MLDCETPLGKKFMNEQYKTQALLEARGYTIVNTPSKDHNSDILLAKEIDGLLTLYGIAEIKSRRMAGDKVLDRAYVEQNGYLVTYDKIKYGAQISSFYKVPFFLIVNLLLDNRILVWQLTQPNGSHTMDFKILETKTQATCNGGSAIRRNAYLPFDTPYLTEIVYE